MQHAGQSAQTAWRERGGAREVAQYTRPRWYAAVTAAKAPPTEPTIPGVIFNRNRQFHSGKLTKPADP